MRGLGNCRDALVTKVTGVTMEGFRGSLWLPPTQSISRTCREHGGLADY